MHDCKVSNIGVRSDHSAVIVSFRITAIKFKVKGKINKIIYWKYINGDAENNIEFNLRLSENITKEHTYTNFNDSILQANKLATTTKPKNQGWFHHSKDRLLPAIELRDHLLTILRNMNEEDTRKVRLQLRQAQKVSPTSFSWKKHHGPHTKREKFTTRASTPRLHGKV